jgi:poly(3-hydroxybutyrate) depolymerase
MRISWLTAVLLLGCGGATEDAAVASGDSGAVETDSSVTDSGGASGDATDSALTPDVAADAQAGTDAAKSDAASGCITDTTPGTHVFTCDGLKYDVTVPDSCPATKCGLVLDVHGATMSGKMEDISTDMRASGRKFGYVVVQPNANPGPPTAAWNPLTDDPKVLAFLELALGTFGIDRKRVHMTGFSQGGMMSSRFLCQHADLFASIAPVAGTGCTFTPGDTPSKEIPVLYMHGTSDALVAFAQGTAQRDALIAAWKMGSETVVSSDAKHSWKRWTNASGTVFEFIQHDYQASSFVLRGHCFPGSKDLSPSEPGQLFGFACTDVAAFTWSDVVMKFFLDHPAK